MHQEHYHLNGTTLYNGNMSFPTNALTNKKWLETHLRPLTSDDKILRMFSLFAAETQEGLESFTLICLKSGPFKINSVTRHCGMKDMVVISEKTWIIENDVGQNKHFEFRHHLKEKLTENVGWNTLSDVIALPAYRQPN